MSIIIPGMKMPTRCLDCPFMVSRDNDDCILQSAELNESFENWEQMKAGCPLIELPPHGRLIDADALVKKSYEIKSSVGRYSRVVHIEDVKNADTIIPADPKER